MGTRAIQCGLPSSFMPMRSPVPSNKPPSKQLNNLTARSRVKIFRKFKFSRAHLFHMHATLALEEAKKPFSAGKRAEVTGGPHG